MKFLALTLLLATTPIMAETVPELGSNIIEQGESFYNYRMNALRKINRFGRDVNHLIHIVENVEDYEHVYARYLDVHARGQVLYRLVYINADKENITNALHNLSQSLVLARRAYLRASQTRTNQQILEQKIEVDASYDLVRGAVHGVIMQDIIEN